MSECNTNKIKQIIRTILLYFVNGSCLAFVIWKTVQCIKTYHEHPVGTRLSLEESANLPFPAITVCGMFGEEQQGEPFNKSFLEKNCNIRFEFCTEIFRRQVELWIF